MDEITYTTQAQMVRERISAVLTTMQGMNLGKNRDAVHLLGAAGGDAEQALILIKMVRGAIDQLGYTVQGLMCPYAQRYKG